MENNGASKVLEEVTTLTSQLNEARDLCGYLRNIIDEGTYKLDAVLNIVSNLKTREQNIIATGASPTVSKQFNAEQVDSLLEMLKSPAFQNIARQFLLKIMEER